LLVAIAKVTPLSLPKRFKSSSSHIAQKSLWVTKSFSIRVVY